MKLPSSLDTLPVPAPMVLVVLTESVSWGANVTVTAAVLFVTSTLHEPEAVPMPVPPEFAPVQPAKTEPALAVAVRVAVAPEL